MAGVTLENVQKIYPNGFQAIYGLDLEVKDGEFMVLVGPSGCGKTTALRLVAGLEELTGGDVVIGDRVVSDVEPKDRDIAMVFQNYALYPNMTVRSNIGFALRLRRMNKAERVRRVDEAIDLLGLTDWADRKPAQLSGGQRQRVAMGRAIVREPSVFLMDEPLSNLDAKLRVQMRAEVARIQRRLGVATLYVTHDQVEAMTMGDRVAVMSAGHLQQCDSPQVVYDHPRNLFVAGFMGSPPMNLFEATVGEGARSLTLGSQVLEVPEEVSALVPELRGYANQSVVFGIRPEDFISLRPVDDTADGPGLVGTVELVEALGSEQLVHFTTDAQAVEVEGTKDDDGEGLNHGKIRKAGAGVARIDTRTPIREGAHVRFGLDPDRLRFFDPGSGEAIGLRQGAGAVPREEHRNGSRASANGSGASGEATDDGGHTGAAVAAGAAVALSAAVLSAGAVHGGDATAVPAPEYDRSAMRTGIVHFGVGGFHRAHEAMYVDRLLQRGGAERWGICGVGVLEADRAMRDALDAQDHLYTLVQKHSDGTYEPRVIGSIVDYLYAPDDPQAVIDRIADPATEIVSLTITEGGYAINDATGSFDPEAPGVADDLAPGAVPRTVFGLVTAALDRRRRAGQTAFTIVSCDNLQSNGALAREAFTSFARQRDPELADWMEAEVRFPNSMVDRITPVTTDADRDEVAARFGIADRWPVVCEPFVQWVLEDSFSGERPAFEDVGVQVVADVAPYELMKLRLLNASHQGLCYFARLCDYTYVHEAAMDPLFRAFLRRYMDEEATPSLDPVPGVDLELYKDQLIERFSNPEIRDTVARLCAESSDRIPKWLLPVVRHRLDHGGPVALSAAIVASWARYADGVDEHGQPIEIVDRRREAMTALAHQWTTDPLAFISPPELFGELAADERFAEPYRRALASLYERGARVTLEDLVRTAV
jgi:mannitol 2-dehydrogenase